jgi:hypothetical protein
MTAILIIFYYNDYYLPFKDKKSADIVRGQLTGLGSLETLYDRCSQAERFVMMSRYRN